MFICVLYSYTKEQRWFCVPAYVDCTVRLESQSIWLWDHPSVQESASENNYYV